MTAFLKNHRIRPHLFVGLAALIAAEVCLFARVEPIYAYFYCFAWWSFILFVEGLVYWRKGNSLLVNRRREFLVLAFWSVAVTSTEPKACELRM